MFLFGLKTRTLMEDRDKVKHHGTPKHKLVLVRPSSERKFVPDQSGETELRAIIRSLQPPSSCHTLSARRRRNEDEELPPAA